MLSFAPFPSRDIEVRSSNFPEATQLFQAQLASKLTHHLSFLLPLHQQHQEARAARVARGTQMAVSCVEGQLPSVAWIGCGYLPLRGEGDSILEHWQSSLGLKHLHLLSLGILSSVTHIFISPNRSSLL